MISLRREDKRNGRAPEACTACHRQVSWRELVGYGYVRLCGSCLRGIETVARLRREAVTR